MNYLIFVDNEGNQFILTNDGNTTIPIDENNRHYQEYLEWLAEGNEPEVIND